MWKWLIGGAVAIFALKKIGDEVSGNSSNTANNAQYDQGSVAPADLQAPQGSTSVPAQPFKPNNYL